MKDAMHTIINVGRSFGSGGGYVGQALARKLGIPFYDNELISQAAEQSGYSKDLFSAGERKRSIFSASSFFASGRMSYLDSAYVNDDLLFKAQSDVIRSIAEKGDAVIIGRCADYILRDLPCLNVFVCGPEEYRIQRLVQNELLPRVLARHPGVEWRPGAQQRDNVEFAWSIVRSYTPALLVILLMLLAEFRSLRQSAVVLAVVPLGVLGGLLGHVVHGEMVSNMSVFGFVALSGVVVNNAIIFVDSINRLRREGWPLREAVVAGSLSRLRPIAMTTFTTVAGLMPMMLERSFQAREMVPMAFTVCWGLLLGALMALFVTPVLVEWLALRESRPGRSAAK